MELVAGEELDASLFTWDGPSRSEVAENDLRLAKHEADMERRRAWVAANVAADPVRLQLEDPIELHWWDDEMGAFEASLVYGSIGSLARWPVSADAWDLGWREVQHRWTDARWDWAMTLHEARPSSGALDAVRARLSGVDRQPVDEA